MVTNVGGEKKQKTKQKILNQIKGIIFDLDLVCIIMIQQENEEVEQEESKENSGSFPTLFFSFIFFH